MIQRKYVFVYFFLENVEKKKWGKIMKTSAACVLQNV